MSKLRSTLTIPRSKLQKGENGRNLCRFCQKEVPKGRITMCSEECAHEYGIRCNPSYARRQVLSRDKGVCVLCGYDCVKLEKRIKKLINKISHETYYDRHTKTYKRRRPLWRQRVVDFANKHPTLFIIGRYSQVSDKTLWAMDHMLPVVLGGGECGLDNLRTLCNRCHKEETKKLHVILKQKRLSEKKKD